MSGNYVKSIADLFKGIIKKNDVNYFEIFIKGVSISLEAANGLSRAFDDGIVDSRELLKVKELERKGDVHVHESLKIVEEAFITPINQSDIVEILKLIENVTDGIDDAANHIYIMRLDTDDTYMRHFVKIIISSCEKLHELMKSLKHFKEQQYSDLRRLIVEINDLEEEGDRTYSESMRYLFQYEKDPVNIIKKKEIYQRLEYAIDCVEDVADVIEKLIASKI